MPVVNKITLDADLNEPMIDEAPLVTQNDTIEMTINVLKGDTEFDLTDVTTVSLVSRRNDGVVVVDGGEVGTGNSVIINLSRNATQSIGTAKFSVQLYDENDERVSTLFGMFVVQEDMSNNASALPEADQSLIQNVLGEGPQVISAAQLATVDANTLIDNTGHKNEYDENTTYKKNNVVHYQGSSYMAKQETQGNLPTNTTYWGLLAKKGQDGTGTVHVKEQTFIATENQSVFNLDYEYDQFESRMFVWVDGYPQFTPENYEETSATSFTLNEGVPVGTVVKVKHFSQALDLKSDTQQVVDNHTTVLNNHTETLLDKADTTYVDSEINTLDTKVDENYNQLTTNLAEIAINVKSFGVVGDYDSLADSGTDDTNAIKEAISSLKDGDTLYFPSGTYGFSSKLVFGDLLKNITIKGKNAVLHDMCQPATSDDGVTILVPVGIEFSNLNNITIDGVSFGSATKLRKKINPTETYKRIPNVDIKNCKTVNFLNNEAVGLGGAWIDVDHTDPDIEKRMLAYYFRFISCEQVNVIESGINSNTSGGGEFFGFIDCKHLNWKDGYSIQENSNIFWSFGKVIACENVVVNGHNIYSVSTGSLMDVSGKNIVIENIHIDYPEGKLLDITSEWGAVNGDTDNVTIRNCSANGRGIFSSTIDYFLTNELSIDNILIENLLLNNKYPDERQQGLQLPLFKNVTLKDSKIINYSEVIYGHTFYDWVSDLEKNIVIDNCEFTSDENVYNSRLTIDVVTGKTVIRNSRIETDVNSSLVLNDRFQSYRTDGGNISTSKAKLTIENTVIKNTTIEIKANVLFKNCVFDNVKIREYNAGNTYDGVTVEFEGGEWIFTDDETPVNTDGTHLDLRTATHVTWKNFTFKGAALNSGGSYLFSSLSRDRQTYGKVFPKVVFSNVVFDLQQANGDGSYSPYLLLELMNSKDGAEDIAFNNVKFGENIQPLNLLGAFKSDHVNNMTIKFQNCMFNKDDSVSIDDYGNMSNLDLLLQNNTFSNDVIGVLSPRETDFNKLVYTGNIIW